MEKDCNILIGQDTLEDTAENLLYILRDNENTVEEAVPVISQLIAELIEDISTSPEQYFDTEKFYNLLSEQTENNAA